jgi:iron(III) transport system ATP-binding protein
MNLGRIEQLGTPKEIYERPRSEFVARFIGASNVLKGKRLDGSHIEIAGVAVRCDATAIAGPDAAISIRQHDIRLLTTPPPLQSENMIPATVARNVFLGASRDYMVELSDGTQLRVVTSPTEDIAQGTGIFVHLPPACCRVLMN